MYSLWLDNATFTYNIIEMIIFVQAIVQCCTGIAEVMGSIPAQA